MKTIESKIKRYACEYCDATHTDSNWMQDHEEDHEKVDKLELGQLVTYNFDRGYTRTGKVIKKDVINTRFLMEIFFISYVLLVLLNYPIMTRITVNFYKAKNRELDLVAVVLILILSILFPLTWFAALIFVLIEE